MTKQAAESVDDRFLGDYLFHESPAQVAIVGGLPDVLLQAPPAGVQVLKLEALQDAEALVMQPQTPSQSVCRTLVLRIDANHDDLALQLGRAIRAFPHRVLLHCRTSPASTSLSNEMFYAFGFRVLPVIQDENPGQDHTRWFEYRLSSYKSAPDWLNARFWANPERFDLLENPDDYCEESDDDQDQ